MAPPLLWPRAGGSLMGKAMADARRFSCAAHFSVPDGAPSQFPFTGTGDYANDFGHGYIQTEARARLPSPLRGIRDHRRTHRNPCSPL